VPVWYVELFSHDASRCSSSVYSEREPLRKMASFITGWTRHQNQHWPELKAVQNHQNYHFFNVSWSADFKRRSQRRRAFTSAVLDTLVFTHSTTVTDRVTIACIRPAVHSPCCAIASRGKSTNISLGLCLSAKHKVRTPGFRPYRINCCMLARR